LRIHHPPLVLVALLAFPINASEVFLLLKIASLLLLLSWAPTWFAHSREFASFLPWPYCKLGSGVSLTTSKQQPQIEPQPQTQPLPTLLMNPFFQEPRLFDCIPSSIGGLLLNNWIDPKASKILILCSLSKNSTLTRSIRQVSTRVLIEAN